MIVKSVIAQSHISHDTPGIPNAFYFSRMTSGYVFRMCFCPFLSVCACVVGCGFRGGGG